MIIYAVNNGYLKEIPVNKISEYEAGLFAWVRDAHGDLTAHIKETGVLSEEDENRLKDILSEFTKDFIKTLS